MSMQTDDRIEQELRAAFRAAADDVQPLRRPLPHTPERRAARPHGATAQRWLVPAVAAAVIAAIGLPLLAFTVLRGASGPNIQAASIVTMSGSRATVAGVSFPVPDGWTTKVVGSTSSAVTVCVAAQPVPDCGGVTVRIAVPDGGGDITPLRGPLSTSLADSPASTPAEDLPTEPTGTTPDSLVPTAGSSVGNAAGAPGTAGPRTTAPPPDPRTETCPTIVDTEPLAGRPAVHLSIGQCAPGSPRSADWFVTDGSLAISTPRGVAAAQATWIAAGLDLSGYRHAYGPQIMFLAEPGVASSHAIAPTG